MNISDFINVQGGGFFIECGANDGKFYSRTLQLEKDFGWGGLLIEASPSLFGKLRKSRRSAWMANVCLSGKIEKVCCNLNGNKLFCNDKKSTNLG